MTTITAHGLALRHYAEQSFGTGLPQSKNLLRQRFLVSQQNWVDRINKTFRRRRIPSRHRKAIRQAVTFVTVQTLEVSTRPSSGGGASGRSEAMSRKVQLLSSNFAAFKLPADTPLLQLVLTTYFETADADADADAAAAAAAAATAAPSPPRRDDGRKPDAAPKTPRTPNGQQQARNANAARLFLPPNHVYCGINPMILHLNQSAWMQLVQFVRSCRIGSPASSGSDRFDEVARKLLRCKTLDQMAPFEKEIDALSTST